MSCIPAWVEKEVEYTPLEANMERPYALGAHDAFMDEYLSYMERCFFIKANQEMLEVIKNLKTALIRNNQKVKLDSEATIEKDVVG